MSIVDIHEARILLGLPEFLIRDFIQYGFNDRRLQPIDSDLSVYGFTVEEIQNFRTHLESSWLGNGRPAIPEHVKRYLKYESQGICALCHMSRPNYEYAHIQPWVKSRSHSPHNILHLCLDCHASYGSDVKLLKGLKEELLYRARVLDSDFVYDCDRCMVTGDAVYLLNGKAHLADATDMEATATGFVKTKIGETRCTVQRHGVAIVDNLLPGEKYFLSTDRPGKIVVHQELESIQNPKKSFGLQSVGKAESNKHLAVLIAETIWVESDSQ